MAAYFDEPDHSGHRGGPFSDLVYTIHTCITHDIVCCFEWKGLFRKKNTFFRVGEGE